MKLSKYQKQQKKLREQIIVDLLAKGELEEAGTKAEEWGMEISGLTTDRPAEDPVLPDTLPDTPPDTSPDTPPTPLSPDTHEPPLPPSGWPEISDLVITSHPINKRMMVATLPDRRRVTLWKQGVTFPVGAMVRAKLYEVVGDEAYYEPEIT